jgi:hypothetical protein
MRRKCSFALKKFMANYRVYVYQVSTVVGVTAFVAVRSRASKFNSSSSSSTSPSSTSARRWPKFVSSLPGKMSSATSSKAMVLTRSSYTLFFGTLQTTWEISSVLLVHISCGGYNFDK